MSVFMTAQITVLAYAGRYLDGGNEQPGGHGDSLDIFFSADKNPSERVTSRVCSTVCQLRSQ